MRTKMFAAAGLLTFASASTVIVGCSAATHHVPTGQVTSSVVEADPKMVESCEFLGTVYGRSAVGAGTRNRIRKARERAHLQASDLGASHIVIDRVDDEKSVTVMGRAYRCEAVAVTN